MLEQPADKITVDPNAVLQVVINQRNDALNDVAALQAHVSELRAELNELRAAQSTDG